MANVIERYLNKKISAKERLFYMATLLLSVAFILLLLLAPFLKLDFSSYIYYIIVSSLYIIMFFLERIFHKTRLFSIILVSASVLGSYITLIHFFDKMTVEIPLFMIIFLTLTIILFDDKIKYLFVFLQLIADILVCMYCFVLKDGNAIASGASEPYEYVRLELAVVITGVICGVLIAHRNKELASVIAEMESTKALNERVNYAKDMFLVNVSHEILTPLNAIIGVSDLIMESDISDSVKEMVFNISNSSHALMSITTDLLDVSRMNVDSLEPVSEKFDFKMMLNDIINLTSVRILDSKLYFNVDIQPDIPSYIVGDGGKIRQILINLLSNASKYTEEGHMDLTVKAKIEDEDSIRLFFSVKDTGRGIKPENLETIFEPYRRLGNDDDKLVEGNGLGLSLCKKLVSIMGGSLTVESEYGVGSTFAFDVLQKLSKNDTETIAKINNTLVHIASYLPNDSDKEAIDIAMKSMNIDHTAIESAGELEKMFNYEYFDFFFVDSQVYDEIRKNYRGKKINAKKIVLVASCNSASTGNIAGYSIQRPISCLNVANAINQTRNFSLRKNMFNGKLSLKDAKILVVDDNIVNISVATGMIERYGCEVIPASSGKEAIRIFENTPVDFVFLDYMMPEMDGIDTLHELRKVKKKYATTVPVVALTANVVSGAKEMFIDAGFTDYLPKPIEVSKLEKVLLDHMPKELISFITEDEEE